MNRPAQITTSGYVISAASVVLLAVPALKTALESPPMLLCLIAGMGLSVCGMALRWRAHQLEQRRRSGSERVQI